MKKNSEIAKRILYFLLLWIIGLPLAISDCIVVSIRRFNLTKGLHAAESDMLAISIILKELLNVRDNRTNKKM